MKALELAGRFDDRSKNLEAVPGFEDIDFLVRDRDCFLQAAAELRRLAAVEAELERIKALEPVAWIVEGQTIGGGVSQYLAWKKSGAGQVPAPLKTDPTPLYALGSKTDD